MSSSFVTRIEQEKDEPYTVIFTTDDHDKYRHLEDECRKMIGHEKPTVDAEPVRHGHWIECGEPNQDGEFELWFYRCSVCGNASINSNYCPNCGAKMDGKGQDDG